MHPLTISNNMKPLRERGDGGKDETRRRGSLDFIRRGFKPIYCPVKQPRGLARLLDTILVKKGGRRCIWTG